MHRNIQRRVFVETAAVTKGPYAWDAGWVQLCVCWDIEPSLGNAVSLVVTARKTWASRLEIIPSFAAFVMARIIRIHFRRDRCRTFDRPHTRKLRSEVAYLRDLGMPRRCAHTPDNADVHIQCDSKLLSVFPWPVNGNPGSNCHRLLAGNLICCNCGE